MKRDSKLYIKDILESINAIEKFVRGMSFDEFAKDDKTSSAVIRKFEIIGEATTSKAKMEQLSISLLNLDLNR